MCYISDGLFHIKSNTMDQPDFFPIPSPCIGVCEANAKGYCKGCLRSREERLYWHQMTDSQKHQVMHLLSLRKAKIRNRKTEKPDTGEQPIQNLLDF
jgi:hypothetical protein